MKYYTKTLRDQGSDTRGLEQKEMDCAYSWRCFLVKGKGWCFIKHGIRGLESDTFFFFAFVNRIICKEMKWNSMRIFKWLLKPHDMMCGSKHAFCPLLQEWAYCMNNNRIYTHTDSFSMSTREKEQEMDNIKM